MLRTSGCSVLQVSKLKLFWRTLISTTSKIEPSIIDSPEQNVCAFQEDADVCSRCFIRHLKTTHTPTLLTTFSYFEVRNIANHLNGIDKSKHSSLSALNLQYNLKFFQGNSSPKTALVM